METHKAQKFVTLSNGTHAVTITCRLEPEAQKLLELLLRTGISFSVSAHKDLQAA